MKKILATAAIAVALATPAIADDRHGDYLYQDGNHRATVQWDEAANTAQFHRIGSRVWITARVRNLVDEDGFIQFDFNNITFIEDYRSAATSGIFVQGRSHGNVVWQYECKPEIAVP